MCIRESSKNSKPHSQRKTIVENFYGDTPPLIIKLEKT